MISVFFFNLDLLVHIFSLIHFGFCFLRLHFLVQLFFSQIHEIFIARLDSNCDTKLAFRLSDSFDEVDLFTKRVSQSTGLSADSESEDWQASSSI